LASLSPHVFALALHDALPILHLVVGDHRDAVLELVRKLVSRRLLGELEKVEGSVGLARAESAVVEFDLIRRRSQDHGRDLSALGDRKSTRLNSSHQIISYAVF